MRTVQARAYEDESHPEGGRVVILLSDLTVAPLKCGFRIKQVDGTAKPGGALSWPGGDLQPLESRATENGVEIVLGPDVTRSDALTPGAAVEIELPETGVRAEFLWPAIEVGQRRRRNVVIARPRRKAMTEHKADNDHADLSTVAASATSATASDREARSADIHPLAIKNLAPIRDAVTPLSDNGTTTMSQSNSILSQLDALDALADLGAASVAQSDPVPAARSASAAPPAYMQPANDTVFALFTS